MAETITFPNELKKQMKLYVKKADKEGGGEYGFALCKDSNNVIHAGTLRATHMKSGKSVCPKNTSRIGTYHTHPYFKTDKKLQPSIEDLLEVESIKCIGHKSGGKCYLPKSKKTFDAVDRLYGSYLKDRPKELSEKKIKQLRKQLKDKPEEVERLNKKRKKEIAISQKKYSKLRNKAIKEFKVIKLF